MLLLLLSFQFRYYFSTVLKTAKIFLRETDLFPDQSEWKVFVNAIGLADFSPIEEFAKDGSEELFTRTLCVRIDDCAKDGGKEFFTKMHCVLITNP